MQIVRHWMRIRRRYQIALNVFGCASTLSRMCLAALTLFGCSPSGRHADAVEHWRRYLLLDPGSSWAKIARSHLELIESPEKREPPTSPRGAASDRWGIPPERREATPERREAAPEGSPPE